jgi:hypothetical protein
MVESLATLLFLVIVLMIIHQFKFFRSSGLSLKELYFFFGLKLVAGIVLIVIYTKIYPDRLTADIFKFYDDSELIYKQLFNQNPVVYLKMIFGFENASEVNSIIEQTSYWNKPFETLWFNDNRTIIRLNMLIRIFSGGYYGIHTIMFNFCSFIGIMFLFKTFKRLFKEKMILLKVACFLIPSVLIWTSGITKESILIFAIGGFMFHLLAIAFRNGNIFWNIFMILIFGAILAIIKSYFLALLLPGIVVLSCSEFIFKRLLKINYSILYFMLTVVLFGALFLFNMVYIKFDWIHALSRIQADFINVAHATNSMSYFTMEKIDSFSTVIRNIPFALYNSLMRPILFSSTNPLKILAGIENLIVLIVIILAIINRKSIPNNYKGIWLFIGLFCFIILLLLGLILPIEGALMRFKAPILPFLLIFLLATIDLEKSKRKA